jgi:hypothetical protein
MLITLPQSGALLDNGLAVAVGQILPLSDILAGQVQFLSIPNTFGRGYAQFTYQVLDPVFPLCGDNGNGDLSIDVASVNDAPSFSKGSDLQLLDLAGPQVVPNWAKQISAGPPNEASQKVHFGVTNDSPSLFAAQPTVDASGNLTFQPLLGASGVANVSVVAIDDGGTANGGLDTSQPQTFTIGISLAKPLHNRLIPADVSGDGHVVAEDALDVINFIHAHGSGPVAPAKPGDPPATLLYDVTIINYINAHPVAQQEALATLQSSTISPTDNDTLLTLLALDSASQKRRKI